MFISTHHISFPLLLFSTLDEEYFGGFFSMKSNSEYLTLHVIPKFLLACYILCNSLDITPPIFLHGQYVLF